MSLCEFGFLLGLLLLGLFSLVLGLLFESLLFFLGLALAFSVIGFTVRTSLLALLTTLALSLFLALSAFLLFTLPAALLAVRTFLGLALSTDLVQAKNKMPNNRSPLPFRAATSP
jgi:hypothetical protein